MVLKIKMCNPQIQIAKPVLSVTRSLALLPISLWPAHIHVPSQHFLIFVNNPTNTNLLDLKVSESLWILHCFSYSPSHLPGLDFLISEDLCQPFSLTSTLQVQAPQIIAITLCLNSLCSSSLLQSILYLIGSVLHIYIYQILWSHIRKQKQKTETPIGSL